jgi:hypothetical protein
MINFCSISIREVPKVLELMNIQQNSCAKLREIIYMKTDGKQVARYVGGLKLATEDRIGLQMLLNVIDARDMTFRE